MNCSNCNHELTNVYASRSVELEKDNGKWIEKNVFVSGCCCPYCHAQLSDEEVDDLGITGY